MSQRRYSLLIAIMVVASSLVTLPALADSNVRIVRLSNINGDAQINQNDKDQNFTHAVLNMPVTSGMWVYTPAGGRAEIQFENGSTVRLVEDAQIQFEKLALAKSGGKINVIHVDHGVVYFNFSKVDKADQIMIDAAGRTFRVDKPAHLRIDAKDKVVSLAVLHGQARLDGDDGFAIKDNQTLFLNPTDPEQLKVAKGTDKFGTDAWDKNRDDELVVQSTHSNSAMGLNGYDAQISSLGNYGNFLAVPGYGNVWQPFGMSAGWDPFMNGTWGFYPGMGYAFISPYAWGWAPYRYGQWNYLSSYGWFWAPGAATSAWNLGPSFGAVPAGWRAPAQPAVGASMKPAQLVVVGNPPGVHPTILAGHPNLNTHPAPVNTVNSMRPIGINRAQSGIAGKSSPMAGRASARPPGGPSLSSGNTASHASSGGVVGGGHPK